MTEPGAAPLRSATRPRSCLPLGPTTRVRSASIISAITTKPAAQLNAISPSLIAPSNSTNGSLVTTR